jgi:hypothetical protein
MSAAPPWENGFVSHRFLYFADGPGKLLNQNKGLASFHTVVGGRHPVCPS